MIQIYPLVRVLHSIYCEFAFMCMIDIDSGMYDVFLTQIHITGEKVHIDT